MALSLREEKERYGNYIQMKGGEQGRDVNDIEQRRI